MAVVLVGLLVGAGSLVLRFRRARGVERLRLRWLALAGACASVLLLAGLVAGLLGRDAVVLASLALCLALLPLATGAAILRYRLYDLDRVISRTVAYGLLTVVLGLAYAGAVLVAGQLFGGIGGQPPSWAVAGATLAMAAMFQPARRRVQQAVDRRFNRRRYDAAQTVEAFAVRLRDQVDLDALNAELLGVSPRPCSPPAPRCGSGNRRLRRHANAGTRPASKVRPGRREWRPCAEPSAAPPPFSFSPWWSPPARGMAPTRSLGRRPA